VEIRNNDDTELVIQTVSVNSNNFRISLTKQTIGPNSSGNISVTHLPREMSCCDGKMTVATNRGQFSIPMRGCGVFSPYKMPPVIKAKIMPDWSYKQGLNIHNPFESALEILEIYTTGTITLLLPGSEDILCLEDDRGCKAQLEEDKKMIWTVQPHETRHIVTVVFQSDTIGEHSGLVHIKTNAHMLVIPVEYPSLKIHSKAYLQN